MKQINIILILLLIGAVSNAQTPVQIKVDGMSCGFCVNGVEKKFSKSKEVKDLHVDLEKGMVTFNVAKGVKVDKDKYTGLVEKAGYEPRQIMVGDEIKAETVGFAKQINYVPELNGIITSTFKVSGNYSEYLEKKNERAENDGVVLDKNRKLFLKELDWVRRMPQARSTKAKSRIDKFDELKQELSQQRDATMLQINIKANRLGSKIIEAHNIGKAYDGKKLFSGFSYKFKRFDRVGIIGPNGTGKSTFLQIITGGLIPDDGKIVIGETVVFGYYTQSGMKLKEDRRVIDVITDVAEYIPTEKGHNITAASLLEKFMFPREQQQVFASQLSGGEKRRLYLLTILMANPNFLILDEPTNDLDLVTLNVLEEFLTTFQGCVVLVSHDRYFMDKLVDHLFVFGQDNKIIDYPGNYTQYRAYLELEEQNLREAKNNPVEVVAKPAAIVSYEDKKEIQKVEREIKKLEEERASITEKFNDMTMSVEDIQKHSTRLKEVESQIEEKEMKWMELVEGV